MLCVRVLLLRLKHVLLPLLRQLCVTRLARRALDARLPLPRLVAESADLLRDTMFVLVQRRAVRLLHVAALLLSLVQGPPQRRRLHLERIHGLPVPQCLRRPLRLGRRHDRRHLRLSGRLEGQLGPVQVVHRPLEAFTVLHLRLHRGITQVHVVLFHFPEPRHQLGHVSRRLVLDHRQRVLPHAALLRHGFLLAGAVQVNRPPQLCRMLLTAVLQGPQ